MKTRTKSDPSLLDNDPGTHSPIDSFEVLFVSEPRSWAELGEYLKGPEELVFPVFLRGNTRYEHVSTLLNTRLVKRPTQSRRQALSISSVTPSHAKALATHVVTSIFKKQWPFRGATTQLV